MHIIPFLCRQTRTIHSWAIIFYICLQIQRYERCNPTNVTVKYHNNVCREIGQAICPLCIRETNSTINAIINVYYLLVVSMPLITQQLATIICVCESRFIIIRFFIYAFLCSFLRKIKIMYVYQQNLVISRKSLQSCMFIQTTHHYMYWKLNDKWIVEILNWFFSNRRLIIIPILCRTKATTNIIK